MVPGRRAGWWVTIWLVSRLTPQEQPGPQLAWFKSSLSFSNSNCVECAWRKSSHSTFSGNCVAWRKSSASNLHGNCVEVCGCAVRDSKDPGGPVLEFSRDAWAAFVAGVKAGELCLP
jgi:hypothetical protein